MAVLTTGEIAVDADVRWTLLLVGDRIVPIVIALPHPDAGKRATISSVT
jgi:hypothetical protein